MEKKMHFNVTENLLNLLKSTNKKNLIQITNYIKKQMTLFKLHFKKTTTIQNSL